MWPQIEVAPIVDSESGQVPGRMSGSRQVHLLCSYPKCGRTWLRLLLTAYFSDINAYPHPVDYINMFRMFPNNDRDPVRGVTAYAFAADQRLPLLLFDHSPSRNIPAGTKVIFLLRGVLDTLVSNYHQIRFRQGAFQGDTSQFALAHPAGMIGIVDYLNGWAEHLLHCPHRLISYEAMHEDIVATVSQVLLFLGMEVDARALSRAIDCAQFPRMQEIERRDGFPGQPLSQFAEPSAAMRARVGKVGGYAAYFDDQTLVKLRAYADRRLSTRAKHLLVSQRLGTDLCLPS